MAASAIFAFERFRLLFERGNLEDQPGYGTRKWHTNFAGMLAYEKRLQQPAIWDDDIAAKSLRKQRCDHYTPERARECLEGMIDTLKQE